MTDVELYEWIEHSMKALREAMNHPNDEDKAKALWDLKLRTERVLRAIEARIEVSYKAYPAYEPTWVSK